MKHQEHELLDHRGLSAPEPDPAPAAETAGPIRTDAPGLSDGASPSTVQYDAAEREPAPASVGGGADGPEPDAAADKPLLKQYPAPDKESQQMGWVQHMNSLKAQVEEVILTELIYS